MKHSPIVREYSLEQLMRYESRNAAKSAGFVLILIFLSMIIAGCLIWSAT